LGRKSRVVRALVSVVISVLTILFFYGYLAPLGLSPTLIFGPNFSNIFGSSTTTGTLTSFVPNAYASFLPGGAAGLIAYTVLRKMGGVTSAAMAPSMSSPDEMMKKMNMDGIMNRMSMMGGAMGPMGAPTALPADITRSQFVVLRGYRQGMKNSSQIADTLSMNKADVDSETSALVTNGYLTKDLKLSSKAMDVLGS
jgi:hypothetical protein